MLNIPKTTLFLIQSLDGKISTGDVDSLDVDKDFSRIVGVKEGLHQYYDLEKRTDRVSFNSGSVQVKVGVNQRTWKKDREDVSFVVVDQDQVLRRILVTIEASQPKGNLISSIPNSSKLCRSCHFHLQKDGFQQTLHG